MARFLNLNHLARSQGVAIMLAANLPQLLAF